MSDNDILKDYNELYRQNLSDWSEYYPEAYRDLAVVTGNQFNDEDLLFLKSQNRNAFVFNYIRRNIKQLTGYQRKNRLASLCDPVEGGDQAVADFLSDQLLYVMQNAEGYNILSSAFESTLITGLSLISMWMDYSQDPLNGELKYCLEPFNSFILDSQFTRLDLSDCSNLSRRRYIDKDTAKMLLPERAKDIEELNPSQHGDDKYQYMSYSRNNAGHRPLLRYDEFWRRTTKKGYILIDTISGQTQKWQGNKKQLDFFIQSYPSLISKEIYEPTVELNVIIEDVVMYSGEDPYGLNDYPFVPVIGYFNPEYDNFAYKLQGVARGSRDAQEDYNQMRSKESDIIKSQLNSGWEIEEGQVKNPRDLYKTGQGSVIVRTIGSPPLTRIQPPELSQAFPLMISELKNDILQLSGSSEELLGIAEGGNTEVSGTLAKQRAANALTTFQDLFDNLSLSQKLMSEKSLRMIMANWTTEKMQRISGKELPPGIDDVDVAKYDIVVKESLLTDTQRNLHYLQLLEAVKSGIEIPQSALIEALPIADKTKLMEAYEQEQQAKQEQQQKIEAQEEMLRQLQQAKVYSDVSLGQERLQRGVADASLAVERVSEARENVSKAALNNLELMEKIKGLRQDQIIQAMQFIKGMTEPEIQEDRAYIQEQQAQLGAQVTSII